MSATRSEVSRRTGALSPRRCCRWPWASAPTPPFSASPARSSSGPSPIRRPTGWSSSGTARPASASPKTGFRPRSISTSRTAASSFEQVAIVYGANENLTGDGEPERIATVRISSNLLPMLGAQPAARTPLHRGRRQADAGQHGDSRLRDLGPALRPGSERRRTAHRAERTAVSDRRRAARVLLAAARGRADAGQRRGGGHDHSAAAGPGRGAGAKPRGLQRRRRF